MEIMDQGQVDRVVEAAPREGLWTSVGSWALGEMGVLHPRGGGKTIPAVRDLSIRRIPAGEPNRHMVAAHTHLGAIFLAMLGAGEL